MKTKELKSISKYLGLFVLIPLIFTLEVIDKRKIYSLVILINKLKGGKNARR